nr:MATE family efflux transporter [Paenibacillus humicola]
MPKLQKQLGVVQKRVKPKSKRLEPDEIPSLEAGGPKVIRKRLMQLAAPSLTEMILLNFVQMINMMMVGRVGPEAVAAVGLTNQPVFFSLAIFTALNVGTTAIVARSIGAGQFEEGNRAAQQTFLLNLFLAILLVCLGTTFAKQLLILWERPLKFWLRESTIRGSSFFR